MRCTKPAGSRALHMHRTLAGCSLAARLRATLDRAPSHGRNPAPCPSCDQTTARPDVVWFGEIPRHLDGSDAALVRGRSLLSRIVAPAARVYPSRGFSWSCRRCGWLAADAGNQPRSTSHRFRPAPGSPAVTRSVPDWVESTHGTAGLNLSLIPVISSADLRPPLSSPPAPAPPRVAPVGRRSRKGLGSVHPPRRRCRAGIRAVRDCPTSSARQLTAGGIEERFGKRPRCLRDCGAVRARSTSRRFVLEVREQNHVALASTRSDGAGVSSFPAQIVLPLQRRVKGAEFSQDYGF